MLLLLPMPVYAAVTFGSWTPLSGSGINVTVSSSGADNVNNVLSISPPVGTSFNGELTLSAPVQSISGYTTPVSGKRSDLTATLTGASNLSSGRLRIYVTNKYTFGGPGEYSFDPLIDTNNNQFKSSSVGKDYVYPTDVIYVRIRFTDNSVTSITPYTLTFVGAKTN